MKTIYESEFVCTGESANESLEDNFLITFAEGAPPDVAEYCFIHRPGINLTASLIPGDVIAIGEQTWPVTAVGAVAETNLRELGHITVRFDGASEAEFPGTVHVKGPTPASIELGKKFRVLSE
ncbi:PTS glucitol/sorbitol transporter subunit IIA [Enterobacter roggenkampii]|uniref:PTS glucitol/sorbitol transporter subunit IIA n=1 Tax=Enterobacter roggenkampii TaxID=1812935 RepID=UPI0008DD085D|nr:PTS glucitol/sorbitol transporter subunit IIA [Enterobacter roggenkampii]OHY45158.1 PTS glucitol/sorbitol transporter subunit IIA [Enterobacter roggenkampii]OHY63609.1 PTS glucitol/sorbitol transporter subunit IIA [Enterobacter roggenkampii]